MNQGLALGLLSWFLGLGTAVITLGDTLPPWARFVLAILAGVLSALVIALAHRVDDRLGS